MKNFQQKVLIYLLAPGGSGGVTTMHESALSIVAPTECLNFAFSCSMLKGLLKILCCFVIQ